MYKKIDIKIFILLSLIAILIVFLATGCNNIYGSQIDWLAQGVSLPEYFRTLFYHTGNLFPNFALNLGGGQNIYNFAYYGLLNPYILFSYLLPFIKMIDYIVLMNILIVISSGFLIYKWLSNNKFDRVISIVTAIIFMLTSSLIFQAHRQYVFIDYLPFLILGLMGIDKYFHNNHKWLYILSVFLMMMTSFYYSVGGLVALFVYGIYKIIKEKHEYFIVNILKIIYPMIIGILMASIFLVPTIMSILASRSELVRHISLTSLFVPYFNLEGLLYHAYGMGFTAIAFLSIIGVIFSSSKEKKLLSIIFIAILSIPIFVYGLNGLLYLRNKVLVAFSPFIGLLIASFLTSLKEKKIDKSIFITLISFLSILFYFLGYKELFYYVDLLLTIIAISLFYRRDKIIILYIVIILISFSNAYFNNTTEQFVSKNMAKEVFNAKQRELVNDILNKDKTFYRMNNLMGNPGLTLNRIDNARYYQTSSYSSVYNLNYSTFYNDIMENARPYRNNFMLGQSNNIMFNTLMGVKYVITSSDNVPIGYSLVSGSESEGVYQNNNVLPLGYATSLSLDETIFDKLTYPYTNEALLNYAVLEGGDKNYSSHLEPFVLDSNYHIDSKITFNQEGSKWTINANAPGNIKVSLKNPIDNKVLFIGFDLKEAPSCKKGDIFITINNISNKLTCKDWIYANNNYHFGYVISSPEAIENLNIAFSKGKFDIDNIELYTLDYQYIDVIKTKADPFIVDMSRTKDNKIVGHIKVTKDGYFVTTIPYDKSFTILVNNKNISYEKVNKSFIGFPIKSGEYEIKMFYQAKGFNFGLTISIIGCILFIISVLWDKGKKEVR